jgi:co-chaperonin GroES (HSP10)
MINTSGLHPQGVAVLTYPYEPEILSTIIAIPDTVREGLSVLENRVIVVEVGPTAWDDEKVPRAQVGDVVLITKYAGFVASGADGKLYRMVNAREIFCKIDTEMFAKNKSSSATPTPPASGRKGYTTVATGGFA